MMTAYAFEGGVSREPVQGALPITEEQYLAAIDAMIDGLEITVVGGLHFRQPQPTPHHIWQDGGWTLPDPEPDPISAADVDEVRDQRFISGFLFQGVQYQSRFSDMENIAGAATAALAAITAGAEPGDYRWHGGEADFQWIAADNSTHAMDAQTMFAFGKAAMDHKQAHIFAARALKDMDPIPADFAENEAYWP